MHGVEVVIDSATRDSLARIQPGLLASVAMGIACFAALGLALAALARNARSVPAIANATLLPLAFFSDIFIVGDVPRWMNVVGAIFPLKHFANAVADGVNPTIPGAGFFPVHLAVMGVWLVIGPHRIPARFEEGHSKEEKMAAVHYLRFALPDAARAVAEEARAARVMASRPVLAISITP